MYHKGCWIIPGLSTSGFHIQSNKFEVRGGGGGEDPLYNSNEVSLDHNRTAVLENAWTVLTTLSVSASVLTQSSLQGAI